jgi:hypothetical protein
MAVRAKMQVTEVGKNTWGKVKVTLTPQYDPSIEEDRRFSKATPPGGSTIQLTIDNPPASDQLALGKFFYVDFTEISQVETEGKSAA